VDLVLDLLRVVAFNTADGWMRDVTADIARAARFRGAGGMISLAIFRVLVHDCSYNNHYKHSFSEHRLIPNPIDQNPWAHWRSPMDMMRQG
jgi:hypothetical protein